MTLIDTLNTLLADHQVFYQKLRNYHWNVKGPHFYVLHEKFEELYGSVNEIVDELAERIVALGSRPLSTMKEQLAAARLAEDQSVPGARQMVDAVIADIDALVGHLKSAREAAGDDSVTANMLDGFVDGYAGPRWMLNAFRSE
jgi:starvation-inducible DNA-binding protein